MGTKCATTGIQEICDGVRPACPVYRTHETREGDGACRLGWLENALNRGWVNYPFTVKYDPLLAPFHHEQRFQTIAGRMRREWEEFEV